MTLQASGKKESEGCLCVDRDRPRRDNYRDLADRDSAFGRKAPNSTAEKSAYCLTRLIALLM
jgi:hypothetical protein